MITGLSYEVQKIIRDAFTSGFVFCFVFFVCGARERNSNVFIDSNVFMFEKKPMECWIRMFMFSSTFTDKNKSDEKRSEVTRRSQKFFEVKEESWFESECLCRFAFKFLTSVFSLFSVTKFTKLKMLFSGKEEESSKVWCSTA